MVLFNKKKININNEDFDQQINQNNKNSQINQVFSYQIMPLVCPRCKLVMKKIHEKNITIDYCQQCNGMWLDKGEIDKLIELNKSNQT